MLIAATILKVIGVIGIIGSIINIAKKKKPEENKRTLKGSIVFLVIGVILGFMVSNSNEDSATSIKSEQQIVVDRQKAFSSWAYKLNEPSKKMTDLTPFFNKIIDSLANNQLSRAEAQVAMEQLSNNLNDINDEFRSLKLPNEKTFTKDQFESLKFINTNLQDASKNYSKSAEKLADFIESKNENRLIDASNYLTNANAHVTNATKKLKELTEELGIKPDNSDDISIDLK